MREMQPGLGSKWLPSRPLNECAESQEKYVTLSEPLFPALFSSYKSQSQRPLGTLRPG